MQAQGIDAEGVGTIVDLAGARRRGVTNRGSTVTAVFAPADFTRLFELNLRLGLQMGDNRTLQREHMKLLVDAVVGGLSDTLRHDLETLVDQLRAEAVAISTGRRA